MKKSKPFILSILLFITLLSCNSEKSPAGAAYSYDIENSKLNGVFLYKVNYNKPIFVLDNVYKCNIESAWIENVWNKQVMVFGKPKVLKFDSLYQLLFKLKIENLSNKQIKNFYFIGNQLIPNDLKVDSIVQYRFHNKGIDTIKVPIYRQRNSEYLSDNQKAFDTLTFVKATK